MIRSPLDSIYPNTTFDNNSNAVWEHYNRTSYHYGVFNMEETLELGQVSIESPFNKAFDARVVLWVRKSEYEKGLDSELFDFVKKWLQRDWPIKNVAYPGREHNWKDFSRPNFVDDNFEVPNNIATSKFNLRLLSLNDYLQDYYACKENADHLMGTFGPDGFDWPRPDITLKIHLGDLGYGHWIKYHRRAFAYVANDPKSDRQRGCVYVFPSSKAGYDCELYCWVTKKDFESGFDKELFEWAKVWVNEAWPFGKFECPGRDIDWTTWDNLPEKGK